MAALALVADAAGAEYLPPVAVLLEIREVASIAVRNVLRVLERAAHPVSTRVIPMRAFVCAHSDHEAWRDWLRVLGGVLLTEWLRLARALLVFADLVLAHPGSTDRLFGDILGMPSLKIIRLVPPRQKKMPQLLLGCPAQMPLAAHMTEPIVMRVAAAARAVMPDRFSSADLIVVAPHIITLILADLRVVGSAILALARIDQAAVGLPIFALLSQYLLSVGLTIFALILADLLAVGLIARTLALIDLCAVGAIVISLPF